MVNITVVKGFTLISLNLILLGVRGGIEIVRVIEGILSSVPDI